MYPGNSCYNLLPTLVPFITDRSKAVVLMLIILGVAVVGARCDAFLHVLPFSTLNCCFDRTFLELRSTRLGRINWLFLIFCGLLHVYCLSLFALLFLLVSLLSLFCD